ncbi:alkaline phosphatase family protein [Nocardioides sp.]|uniref:alkaline phosphatase family protein n=1 Tax=Nocardioides sp. TaxID=35761 RepID=UPI003D12539C
MPRNLSTRLRWLVAAAVIPLGVSAALLPAQGSTNAPPGAAAAPATPKRVMFIVLDQLRPEFIDAFDMQNVKALMAGGATFDNAYLGHMASETVVSHNVMTSGMLPKHMGWADEWFRDTDGVLGTPDTMYVSGSMSQPQFDSLVADKGYPKLADYLHAKYPGKIVASFGQKNYAMYAMSTGADIRVTFGGRSFDCDGDAVADNTWRGPVGVNVPTYITEATVAPTCPADSHFYVDADSNLNYGTLTTSPAWNYPLQGNRDISGPDADHPGGDVWTTDAALAVMDHEDWSGLLLTMGGIDKSGHMWGGLNDVAPYPAGAEDPTSHMANAAHVADEQVGRIVDKLEADGLLDETLVVLTTDHAQLTGDNFYGVDGVNRGNLNWYYGADADETYLSPSPEIQKLILGLGGTGFTPATDGNMRVSMQDSAIRTWLDDTSTKAKRQAADVMSTLGGVRASYIRNAGRYVLRWQAPRSQWSDSEWAWYRKHAQEIVNTEAAPYGPDVIGLLADNTSYGAKGDHGGAQESVQRIPIVFYGAGVKAGSRPSGAIRSVDILPTILRDLRIPKTHWMDGKSYYLP